MPAAEVGSGLLSRRTALLATGGLAVFARRPAFAQADDVIVRAQAHAERYVQPGLRSAFVEKARRVARDYTTAPVTLRVADRVYEVPAHYYTPLGRSRFARFAVPGADRFEVPGISEGVGGLSFFWPDFGGFTPYNWYVDRDPRRIEFRQFSVLAAGGQQASTEESLRNLQQAGVVERQASVERHGLRGHRWADQNDFVWVGRRLDGAMFRMRSPDPTTPEDRLPVPLPMCDVRLFDPVSREDVVYGFPLALFEHWREIDARCADAIAGWRRA